MNFKALLSKLKASVNFRAILDRIINKKFLKKFVTAACLMLGGTAVNVYFSNILNASFRRIRLTDEFFGFWDMLGRISTDEQLSKVFWTIEGIIFVAVVYYAFIMRKEFASETVKVADNIIVPVPAGEGQHGTSWFTQNKQLDELFTVLKINGNDDKIKQLLSSGADRYNAVENEKPYEPKILGFKESFWAEGGLVVSREYISLKHQESIRCITDDLHALIIGATRCGKSRCLVLQSIITLALANEALVVNDPKGELYHYTHSCLESLGYQVFVLDFQSVEKSHCYNPLQSVINAVNAGLMSKAQDCAWDLTNILVEDSDKSEPLWTNGEKSVIAAAILCVVCDNVDYPEYQNLTNVYHFISNMAETPQGSKETRIVQYVRTLADEHPAKPLLGIANIAPSKTAGSFYTSALATLRLFTGQDIHSITCESDFVFTDLGAKPKQALFFILPDEKTTYYPIATLLISQMYQDLVGYAKRHGNRLPNRVNFVLDEFGNFAKIEDMVSKLTVGGGYGIRWNFFLQNLEQLNERYGDNVAASIKSNCHNWVYLNSFDYNTNKAISDLLGIYTTSSYSTGASYQRDSNTSTSSNLQLIQRNLLNPDEVSRLKRPYQLVISRDCKAIMRSDDISQWFYNTMLGLGDKKHNARLIDQDEQNRPLRNAEKPLKIWKPWLAKSKAQPMDTKLFNDNERRKANEDS